MNTLNTQYIIYAVLFLVALYIVYQVVVGLFNFIFTYVIYLVILLGIVWFLHKKGFVQTLLRDLGKK